MANTPIDKETIKSAMQLIAALLVFVSTISAIINKRLQKARNAAQRQRLISNILAWGSSGLFIAASVVNYTLANYAISFPIYALAMFIYVVKFLREQTPPSRLEIVLLIFTVSFVTLVAALYWIAKVNALFETFLNAFKK
jgi:drug/metabolite transporter (DMT)-like permease